MNLKFHRRHTLRLLAAGIAAVAFTGAASAQADESSGLSHGKLFISTNAPAGNQVLVYARSATGAPSLLSSFATGGNGTGAALGSQGAVTLSRSGRYLFVVNAASNTISTFTFAGNSMTLTSVVSTGGTSPISVTERDGLVYVLNLGGSGSVAGFQNAAGVLTALPGAVYPLSTAAANAGQVGFNAYGDVLIVSEKATSTLLSYSVRANGTLARPAVTASPGATPFGFATTGNDTLIVSEAAGSSVSSYRFVDNSRFDAPRVVTAGLPNTQAAACWIAVTPNGRFAYSANAGTSSVSSFAVGRDGRIALLAGAAGLTGPNAGAVDMAVSPDGTQLHVFASRAPQIVSFTISTTGGLTPLGTVAGMPLGSGGLAAN